MLKETRLNNNYLGLGGSLHSFDLKNINLSNKKNLNIISISTIIITIVAAISNNITAAVVVVWY